MSQILFRLVVVLCTAALAFASAVRAESSALPATIERMKGSIVGVGTVLPTRRPPGEFVATGFVVGDGRHVITNAHALPRRIETDRREFLAVMTRENGEAIRRAEVIGTDETHDLALLRFEGEALPAVRLGDSARVREGELYAFTGFPIGMVLGFRPVTHRGIVSAITPIAIPQLSSGQLSREMVKRLKEPYDVFQLDATAYPGNSGSPLYEPETGTVVGVVNMVFVKETKESVLEKPSGISYAIPIEFAKALMRKAKLAVR